MNVFCFGGVVVENKKKKEGARERDWGRGEREVKKECVRVYVCACSVFLDYFH